MIDHKERANSFNAAYNSTNTAQNKKKKDFDKFET